MKKTMFIMMTLLLAVVAFRAQAAPNETQDRLVNCKLSDGVIANQFEGEVLLTGSDTVTGQLTLNLSKPGANGASVIATLSGTSRTFAPGRIGVKEVTSVQLVDKTSKVSRAIINVNMPGLLNSSVTVDGITYKSTCKSE
jgi:hypothetical protein